MPIILFKLSVCFGGLLQEEKKKKRKERKKRQKDNIKKKNILKKINPQLKCRELTAK